MDLGEARPVKCGCSVLEVRAELEQFTIGARKLTLLAALAHCFHEYNV